MADQMYDVMYDFVAEGPEELSVKAGDVVAAVPGGDQGDGWTLVQHTRGSDASGFVPSQYMRPAQQGASTNSSAAVSPAQQRYNDSYASQPNSSALALGSHSSPSTATAAHGVSAATQLATQSDAGGMQASEEFSHLFATHEVWYKQASQRRQQTFAALNHAVTDLATKAAESESKTSSLLDRIAELDTLVEDERAKWEEKLKEEQAALAAGTALLTDISSAGN